MLEEVLELSQKNNAMVRKLVHAQQRAAVLRFIYWVIIIGSLVIGYYWAEPYITPLISFFGGQDFAKVMSAVHSLPVIK